MWRVNKILEKNLPNFLKNSQNRCQDKKKWKNDNIKDLFVRLIHSHQTTFENLKYLQQTML